MAISKDPNNVDRRHTYLGDGVYVELSDQDFYLRLTTQDGGKITNSIYLDPDVWARLVDFAERTSLHATPEA